MKRGMVVLMVIGFALILGAWSWSLNGNSITQQQTSSSEMSGSTSAVAECCGTTSKAVRVYDSENQFIGILIDEYLDTGIVGGGLNGYIKVYIPSLNCLATFTYNGGLVSGPFFYIDLPLHYSNQTIYFNRPQTLFYAPADNICSLSERYFISSNEGSTSLSGSLTGANTDGGCGNDGGISIPIGRYYEGIVVTPEFEFDMDGRFIEYMPFHYVYE